MVMEQKYDVAVLGAGPGGYPAAIKLAQHGKKVALIEGKEVGGTCLNRGCIPTKALIANAEVLHNIKDASAFGIDVSGYSISFEKMSKKKDDVVKSLRTSLQGLLKANGIDVIYGYGKFTSPKTISVTGQNSVQIRADNIIIATGSEPKEIPAFRFDNRFIHSSTSILELTTLPKSILIIGGGVIGCEFASLYQELGVQVTLIEALDRILPLECETVSSFITSSFKKRGMNVFSSAMVGSLQAQGNQVTATMKDGKTLTADIALVAIGRSFNSDKIGLDAAGVKTTNGFIQIDDQMKTNVPGIFAIGDITAKAMYAHVASHQGLVAAGAIVGEKHIMNYNAVPGVIFTRPEIGTVGMSLKTALEKGYKAKRATYPFQALGKAKAAHQEEGFAQVVIDEKTHEILGAQVIGHEASNLISPITYAIANELTIDCVADTIHAHPTLHEAWLEAAYLSLGHPLHYPPVKK